MTSPTTPPAVAREQDDPALVGNFSDAWASHIEANDARPMAKLGYTPHPHTVAVKSIMDAAKHLPGLHRIRKRPAGRFVLMDGNGNPRKQGGKWACINVAVKGDPDTELLWKAPGAPLLMIATEAKTGSATLTQEQREKKAALEAMGAHYVVASNGAEAFEAWMHILAKARG